MIGRLEIYRHYRSLAMCNKAEGASVIGRLKLAIFIDKSTDVTDVQRGSRPLHDWVGMRYSYIIGLFRRATKLKAPFLLAGLKYSYIIGLFRRATKLKAPFLLVGLKSSYIIAHLRFATNAKSITPLVDFEGSSKSGQART
jgi:hypothetical protein